MKLPELLSYCIKHKASDLHLMPELPPMARIDGELTAVPEYPKLSMDEIKSIIYSGLSEEEKTELETKSELDMALGLENIGNFRVSVVKHLHGIAAAYRILPPEPETFETLNLPQVLKSLLVLSHGLILITGPTGSGKSTTIAAMIEYMNQIRSAHIITIEDPIEYLFKSKKSIIMQRQVKRDTPTVASALRSALRHDPDIIMLGEMRDLETIRLTLTAAETGHLVLATLHASSAPLAISRIVDIFPHEEKNRVRNLLAETVQAVVCQTLVKKIHGGRIGAFEIMLATPAIRHLIREDKIPHMVMTIQTSGDIGMFTLEQHLQELVLKRQISSATARSATLNHDRFQP